MEDMLTQYDVYIAAGILGLTLVYLYTIGKDFGVTIVLSLYMAVATIYFVPFFADLNFSIGGAPEWVTKVALLLGFILIFSYLQIHNGYFEPSVVPSSWELPIFAILFAGMFVSVSVGFMPVEFTDQFSSIMRQLFVDEPVINAWFLGTPLALLFIKGQA